METSGAPIQEEFEEFTEDTELAATDFADILQDFEVSAEDRSAQEERMPDQQEDGAESEPDRIEGLIHAHEESLRAALECAQLEVASDTTYYSIACDRYGRAIYEGPGESRQLEGSVDISNRIDVSEDGKEVGGAITVLVGQQTIGDRIVYTFASKSYRPAQETEFVESWGEPEGLEETIDEEQHGFLAETTESTEAVDQLEKADTPFWEQLFAAEGAQTIVRETVQEEQQETFFELFPTTVETIDGNFQERAVPFSEVIAVAHYTDSDEQQIVLRGEESEFLRDITVLTVEPGGAVTYQYREAAPSTAMLNQPAFVAPAYNREERTYASTPDAATDIRVPTADNASEAPCAAQLPETPDERPATPSTTALNWETKKTIGTPTIAHEAHIREATVHPPQNIPVPEVQSIDTTTLRHNEVATTEKHVVVPPPELTTNRERAGATLLPLTTQEQVVIVENVAVESAETTMKTLKVAPAEEKRVNADMYDVSPPKVAAVSSEKTVIPPQKDAVTERPPLTIEFLDTPSDTVVTIRDNQAIEPVAVPDMHEIVPRESGNAVMSAEAPPPTSGQLPAAKAETRPDAATPAPLPHLKSEAKLVHQSENSVDIPRTQRENMQQIPATPHEVADAPAAEAHLSVIQAHEIKAVAGEEMSALAAAIETHSSLRQTHEVKTVASEEVTIPATSSMRERPAAAVSRPVRGHAPATTAHAEPGEVVTVVPQQRAENVTSLRATTLQSTAAKTTRTRVEDGVATAPPTTHTAHKAAPEQKTSTAVPRISSIAAPERTAATGNPAEQIALRPRGVNIAALQDDIVSQSTTAALTVPRRATRSA